MSCTRDRGVHSLQTLSGLLLLAACADAGGARIELTLTASGAAPRPLPIANATLTLTRADVAFGPAYFCATDGASAELCEVALAEVRDTVLVRALDPNPQPLGLLAATTGHVHSARYDYGYPWLLSDTQPRLRPGAPEAHSAILEGTLEREGRVLRFRAELDVKPRARGEAAVSGQRTDHVLADGETLSLSVDPQRWVERLDPDALFALDTDGDGFVTIAADTANYESILQGMTTRAPVGFVWR